MPLNLDFENNMFIRTIEIHVDGYIDPLYIEYGISTKIALNNYEGVPCICWRIKGTKHTFIIPVSRIDFLSSGEYEKHFKETLTQFREDYIMWVNNMPEIDWVKEYKEQFDNIIIV